MFQFSLKCSYGGFDYKGKCICCINSYVIRFKWQKRISVTCSVVRKVILLYRGFRPKPWLTFCLDTKSKQKSQSVSWRMLHSKNLRSVGWNRPNSLLRRSNRTVSNANFTCFSVHQTRSVVEKLCAIQYSLYFQRKYLSNALHLLLITRMFFFVTYN